MKKIKPASTVSDILQPAIEHYEKGDLEQAEAISRKVLNAQPNNPDALHLLGVIALRTGKNEEAVQLIGKAIGINGSLFFYHNNLGEVYRRLNRLDEAIACYQNALLLNPADHMAHCNLGNALMDQGKLDEAIECYKLALALKPDFIMAHNNLGNALKNRGNLDEAIACYKRALSLNPNDHMAHNNLGGALKEQGKLDEAIACYRRSLALSPDSHLTHYNLGVTLKDKGEIDEAIACYKQALALKPNDRLTLINLGNAFIDQEKPDEAIAWYKQVLSLKPDDYMAHTNLGSALKEQGKLDEAIACYKQALSQKPDHATAHFNLSLIYLLQGNFKEGWEGYKYRIRLHDITNFFSPNPLDFSQPFWDGSEIKGKTLLLYAEQGIGDVIQFIRYVPMVFERCDKIMIECHKELVTLMQKIRGIDKVVAPGDRLPDFDFHCPLLNLPAVFNTTLETIPASIPYIMSDPDKVIKWAEKLQSHDTKLRIGLCWAGNPKNRLDKKRSISLGMLSILGGIENVTYYSLQKGPAAEQAKNPPKGMDLIDYTSDLSDLSDTAALIETLDLVISVDTAVAHLAGALGKPVWVLLPFMPDWRWMSDRKDSPWYPSMQLFRQTSRGDWANVITSVKKALEQRVYPFI